MAKGQVPQKFILGIERTIVDYSLKYYFIGEFANYMNFTVNENMPTAGVNVTKKGMNLQYNPKFVDSLPQLQANGLLLHEILHLLYEHPKRTKQHHSHYLANIAQDYIINKIIIDDFSRSYCELPEGGLEMPKEYQGKLYFEDVYDWLVEEDDKYKEEKRDHGDKGQPQDQNGDQDGNKQDGDQGGDQEGDQDGNGKGDPSDEDGNGEGSGNGLPSDGRPNQDGKYPDGYNSQVPKSLRDIFDQHSDDPNKTLTLDEHMVNEVPDEIAREIVKDVQEGLKARGLTKGLFDTVIGKLQKKRKDHLKAIKRSVDIMKGTSKTKTICRPNMLGIEGLKGRKKQGHGLNCILDTSGSMTGDFEKTLSYIFQKDILINMVQCDTTVQHYEEITSMQQLQRMDVHGLGGTTLMPGVKHITDSKYLNTFATVILTDGYTDTLDFSKMKKKVLIISSGHECPIHDPHSRCKQIVISKDIS